MRGERQKLPQDCHLRAGPGLWSSAAHELSGLAGARCACRMSSQFYIDYPHSHPKPPLGLGPILRQLEGAHRRLAVGLLPRRRALAAPELAIVAATALRGGPITDPPSSGVVPRRRCAPVVRRPRRRAGEQRTAQRRRSAQPALDRAPAVEKLPRVHPGDFRGGPRGRARAPPHGGRPRPGVGSVLHPSRGCVHVEKVAGVRADRRADGAAVARSAAAVRRAG